jgi:hypothetical protein
MTTQTSQLDPVVERLLANGQHLRVLEAQMQSLNAQLLAMKKPFSPSKPAKATQTTGKKRGKKQKRDTLKESLAGRTGLPEQAQEDDDGFYSTVTKGLRLQKGDNASNIVAKLISFMQKSYEEKKIQYDLAKDFEEENHEKEKIFNEKFMKAIKELKGKPKVKKPQLRDEKGRFKKQTEAEPAKAGTSAPSPAKSTPTPAPATPAPATPAPAASTATKTIVEKAVSVAKTATKVAAPAVAVGGITSAIAGAEAGGDYNRTFGDVRGKNGKLTNANFKTTQEVFHKDLTEMTLEEVKEFGQMKSKNGAGAGAVGAFQFMPSTLFGRTDKTGKHIPGLVEQLGLPMDTKFNKETQDKLEQLLHSQNVSQLKRLGIPLTPGYEYMAHYIGPGGAKAVYEASGTDKTVAEAMMDKNLSVGRNPELYDIKAKDFEKKLAGRLETRGKLSTHATGSEIGDKLNQESTKNQDAKKSENTNVIVNNTVNSTNLVTNKQNVMLLPKTTDIKPLQMETQ